MNSQEIDDKVFGTTSLNPIHCPHESCNKLIRFKNLRSVDYVVTEKTNIVAVFCQSCEMRPGGKMHLCLSCGRYRVGSLSNLTKRCKCPPLTTSTERSRDSDDIPDEEHQEQQGEEQSDFNVGFDAGHVQDIDNPSEEDHQEQQGKEQSDFNVGFDAGHEQDENNVGNAQLFGNDGNEDYDNIVSSDDDIDSSDDDEDEDDDEKATGPNHNHVNFDDMPEDDFDEAAADDDADVGYGGDNTGDMAMLNTEWFDADAFFSTQNNWPRNSSTYFIAEHKDGTGRENIVKNVLFDRNTALGMRNDRISKDEMHDIFHQASTYYNVTSSDRADFCSMVDNVRVGAEVKLKKVNMDWEDAIREASKQCKIEWTEDVNVDKFIEIVKRARYTQTAEREVNDLHIQPIRDAKDVRQKLVEGPKSVIKLLPIPQVSVQSVLDPAVGGKERQFAHIDADQLINHALAYRDNKINYYRAGYEEDWDPDSDLYRNDHLRRKFLGSKKCKEIHDFVKRLVQEGQITKEARIVFMRSWSDAFGAHAITANNEYNSIQVFTIRFKGETDFILPHALLFKKWNSKDMIIELLSEIKELETAKTRYWSSDRKAVETLVFTELVSNDLPERTYNLHFSNNGTYSKWYGHSCLFNACTTPSCENCWRARVDIILGENQTMPVCNECHDWWSTNVLQADIKYPLDPGYSILTMEEQDTPVVSLTLSAMCTSLHELAEWYGKEIIKDREPTIVKDVVQKYVRLICLAEPAKMAEMIFEEYKDIAMSNSYPSMFKEFPRLEVEIALFPSVVMHMFFLGVAKSLIKQSNRLKVVGNQRRDVKAWWKSFHSRILSQQKLIKGLSLSWCYPMSFSATDGNADGDDNETTKKGSKQGQFFTTGWMSSHYVDFTRISLFQYSSLDKKLCEAPAGFEKVIPVFRRLFVLWFCLCANAFAPPPWKHHQQESITWFGCSYPAVLSTIKLQSK